MSSSVAQWNGTTRTTTFISSTQLQLAVSASDLAIGGTAQISVMNPAPGGGTSGGATLTINNPAPVITAANPSSVLAGSAASTVTITGTGFVSASVAQWNGSARTTTFVSSTELQAAIPTADLASGGTAQISVLNPAPGGGTSSATTFTINNPAPVITTANPSAILAGSTGTTVTIAGTGFVSSSVAQWNGSARTTTFVSSTELQAAIPAADLASGSTAQITVLNPAPGGGTSGATAFTVNNPAPTVASASPSTTYVTDTAVVVSVNGTGFVPTSVAQWNGTPRATSVMNSTVLQVTLTAADLTTTGSGNISVSNPAPGGGASTSVAVAIEYAPPYITLLSPSSAVMGSPTTTINVYGSGFAPVSVVQWGGSPLATQYVNSGQLRASIPSANLTSSGTAYITAVNPAPGGGSSAPAMFTITTYPVPAITSVSPSTVLVNSSDTPIRVYGTGFQSVSTIQVNGTDLPTTLASSYYGGVYLTATVPASYFTALGTLQITVNTTPSGGTSNAVTITVATPQAPTITSMSPASAAAGGSDFTLTVYGSNFVSSSVVRWNGKDRPTTYISSSQVTAQISSADIAALGQSQVSVYTPPPGGGSTNSLPFNTYLPLPANDLVYNPTDKLLYASVPSSAGATLGNSIVSIDPNTGVLGTPIWVGSEPNKLALSSDGSTLWVGLDGAGAVRKVDLTTQTAGLQFGLGGGTGIYNSPNMAVSISVMPGFPDSIAVAPYNNSTWWNGGVTIYDGGVARAKTFSNGGSIMNVNAIAFSSSGSSLYALGNGYAVLTIDSTGISNSAEKNSTVSGNTLIYDSGRVYLNSGAVLDAETGTQVGVFSVSPTQQASGPIAVDGVIGRAFILLNPNYGSAYQINAYSTSTYVLAGSTPIGYLNSSSTMKLVRWGQDGLAIRTAGQIFILHSTAVRDLSTSLADLSVSVTGPATPTAGAEATYDISVTNIGPVAATPAVLIDNLPSGAVLKSVSPSQGTCSGTMVLRCDLGDLNVSSSATVQIVATLLLPGMATNMATVSAPEGDPDLTNNSVTTSTTVSGTAVNPLPAVASISPEIIASGSSTFTLTVNGAGFAADATVNWNGTALPTTFVNSSQLAAEVDASNVAALGWAWVSVSNPTPGGGTSTSLPFTIYKTIDLSSNHILFDPFTRKIYASIPSTATQVNGNSIVAIDPLTGALSTPLFVGSEPKRLAESDDGKYLYVGLDGAKGLTRIDLASMTQGSVYPLSVTQYGSSGPTTARDLAVMPGTPDTLAIDTGSWTGIGVFDISGTTGAFRTNFTGPYTGSSLAFGNTSTVYSYDSDTSGATFNRWTVGSTGLASIDKSTLFGFGGFSGAFKLQDGLVYGVAGGLADPTTTPPSQLGRYMVTTLGPNQSFQASGVAPDPAIDRVFFTGSASYGSASPYVVSFDRSRFTVMDALPFPGSNLTGTDLLCWGSDGLAWQMSNYSYYGGGSNTIILMRGPWVLPQWGASNPVATATSVNPASAAAGSGNLIVEVTGSEFVPGAVVLWNGAERTTSFVDSSHLKVAIPTSDLVTAGTATLTVVNPGAGALGEVTFTIN